MNKKLMFGILSLFAVTLVTAGYIVNSFVITTDVYEAFEVEYAIIGDAGNWDGVTTCSDLADDDPLWQVGSHVDVGGLFVGEGRAICTKIVNLGEGSIDYAFSGEVISGLGNLEACQDAFGEDTTLASGTITGLSTVKTGGYIVVAGDATPVDDCQITLSVARG